MATQDSIDVTKYSDLPAMGITTGSATLQVLGIEAVKNTMKMYLLSKKGDYGRDISKGGPLYEMVGKPLIQSNADKIKTRTTTALTQFTNITLNTITVDLDLEKKMFIVKLVFSDNYNKFYSGLSLGITGI